MNKKDRFLNYLNGNHDEWMGYAYDACPKPYPFVIDPVTGAEIAHETEKYTDWWGVPWRQEADDPGAVPLNNEENAIIKDITCWKEFVHFPSLDNLDMEATRAQMSNIDRNENLVIFPFYYGPFERMHTLMPFEECLFSMYEEPESFYDLMGALTDWRIKAAEIVIDEFHPDIMHCHDDWGTGGNLMFKPELFRELMKPHYERFYAFIKSKGVYVQHHNDGIGRGLEKDMVDMHIDMWQGVLEANDIMAMKENTEGKLIYMGGLDQYKLDNPSVTEEEIRSEVRRVIDTYGQGGCFLPCYPSVMALNVPGMFTAIDEMERYGEKWTSENC